MDWNPYSEQDWPRDTKEFVFLARAFHRVGTKIFAGGWSGAEPYTEYAIRLPKDQAAANAAEMEEAREILFWHLEHEQYEPPYSTELWEKACAFNEKDNQERHAAIKRMRRARTTMATAFADGELSCHLRPILGGKISAQLDPDLWNTEEIDARFETCQMSDQPFDFYASYDRQWIFVGRESLDRYCGGLGTTPVQPEISQHLSPYLKLMITVSGALQVSPENQPKLEEVLAKLRELWPDNLTMSDRMLNAMATAIREPEMQLGRARKTPAK
ncbi:MAG TPA: hypothetical protein VIL84_13520 [Devosiaceae bacterium]